VAPRVAPRHLLSAANLQAIGLIGDWRFADTPSARPGCLHTAWSPHRHGILRALA
jgi:hypothetical protein